MACNPRRLGGREKRALLFSCYNKGTARGITLLPKKKTMHCSPNGLKCRDGKRADLQSGMKHCWPEQNIQSKVNITKYISDMSYWKREKSSRGEEVLLFCVILAASNCTQGNVGEWIDHCFWIRSTQQRNGWIWSEVAYLLLSSNRIQCSLISWLLL